MVSENINLPRIILLLISILSALLTGLILTGTHRDYALFPGLISIISGLVLLRNARQSERHLNYFFDAITSNDSTVVFPENISTVSMRKLHREFNRVNDSINRIKFRSEERELYFRALIQQSATGLIVIDQNGEIELINEAAANFAGISPSSTDKRLLKIRNPELYNHLMKVNTGESKIIHGTSSSAAGTLLIKSREIKTGEKKLKLLSIENIRRELDEKEMESYQNLIRILIHEIMNSVAPLTSVSVTLKKLFHRDGKPLSPDMVDSEIIKSTLKGLATIDEQGKGLINFVNSYRKISRLPKPVIIPFNTAEWLEQIRLMTSEQVREESIDFHIISGKDVPAITADRNLLNQVIVNLVNNAIDALRLQSGQKFLKIQIMRTISRILISIKNNGPAIEAGDLEKIFIPFYTTKENGSGIGLALSRQIIFLHRGFLYVTSSSEETIFTIELPG